MQVAPLRGQEVREAIDVLVDAFWTYPETVHLLPAERTRRFGLTRFMQSTLNDARPFGEVLIARESESIVGVAVWKPPARARRSRASRLRQGFSLLPVGIAAPGAIREAVACSNEMRRRHPTAAHYYLAMIGVHPDRQGRGVGGALLQPILIRADEEGIGCYLSTATPENVVWYKRYDFDVTAEFCPTRRWPTVWNMWRDARANRRLHQTPGASLAGAAESPIRYTDTRPTEVIALN